MRRKAELKKCQVLCKKCHDMKSVKERAKGAQKSHLTDRAVKTMRGDFVKGCSLRDLCSRYALGYSGIRHILKRRTWKHL